MPVWDDWELLRQRSTVTIVGLMTGTSGDSLDICQVRFSGKGAQPLHEILKAESIPLPTYWQVVTRNPLDLTTEKLAQFHFQSTRWVAQQLVYLNNYDLIALHGQTVAHRPPHYTLQLGTPSVLATQLHVPVVYDFRAADVAAGGQGAPLIPVLDRFLWQTEEQSVLALNLGGITNITLLPSAKSKEPIRAWDVGPANMALDQAVRLWSEGKYSCDLEGRFSLEGTVRPRLLEFCLAHPFLKKSPPKSAGWEDFGSEWVKQLIRFAAPRQKQDWLDLFRTLIQFTVECIKRELDYHAPHFKATKAFVTGGGTQNRTLMATLQRVFPEMSWNIPSFQEVKEALGMAYLGYLFLRGLPGNIPSVTGADRPALLGQLALPTKV